MSAEKKIQPDAAHLGALAKEFIRAANAGMDENNWLQFTIISNLEPQDLRDFIVSNGKYVDMATGKPVPIPAPSSPEEFLKLAEIYARGIARSGNEKEFRKFVPMDARTPEVRESLQSNYPKFSALCSGPRLIVVE